MIKLLILYAVIFIMIGILSSFTAQRSKDFYVAGQKGSIFSITSSLLSTILGSSAILGTISLSQTTGWAASWLMICGSLGLICLIPLAKYVRRYGQFTLPDLLEKFYGIELKCLACLMIPVAWTGVIAAQIIGSAKILSYVTPLAYDQAAVLACLLFTTYTILGGQISILKTDQWQGLLIICSLGIALSSAISHHGIPPLKGLPVNNHFLPTDLIILMMTYATTFIVGPDIYSRIFCAKNERTATISIAITALLLIPIAFLLAFIGVTGHAHSFDFLTTGLMPYILTLGLFSAVISSADTTLLTAATTFNELFTDLNESTSIRSTRLLILLFGILSLIVALVLPNIIQSLLLAFSFFTGAFVIPAIAGLLGFRTSKQRVIAAALLGGLIALAGKILLILNYNLGGKLIIDAFILNAAILFLWRKK